MANDKVRQALQWLEDKGWSELIDPRWTLEVYHVLQTSKLNLSDVDIREVLDIVIYDKPDYNPANNERLNFGKGNTRYLFNSSSLFPPGGSTPTMITIYVTAKHEYLVRLQVRYKLRCVSSVVCHNILSM